MSNKQLLKALIGSGSILLSTLSFAATTTMEMSKDEWLGKLKGVVPSLICKSFLDNNELAKQLKSVNIDYDKCVTLIPGSFDMCQAKYYSDLPSIINQDNASKWGRTIGECIGEDFAKKYLMSGSSTSSSTNSTTSTTSSTQTNKPSTSSSTDTMPKDEWLHKLKVAVPDLICKGFLQDKTLNEQLTKVNINYDKCVTLLPASVEKCENQFYADIPASIDEESASKWGHKIGECIGKDFAIKHLFPDSNSTSNY